MSKILLVCILIVSASCRHKQRPSATDDQVLPVAEVMVSDPYYKSRLLRGFYDGPESWKWTAGKFAVSLDPPDPGQRGVLMLDFSVPSELTQQVNPVLLRAKVTGTEVGKAEYSKGRSLLLCSRRSRESAEQKPVEVEFSLDRAGTFPDGRPRGVIVVSVSLRPYDESLIRRETLVNQARAGYQKLLQERNRQLPPAKQQELMKLFHDIPVWREMRFQNVQIEKNPLDLWMMQQIIYEIQPEYVVETGAWRGGSALYWAHTLNGMGLEKSRVITVDIQDQTRLASVNPLWKKYVTLLPGSSTDPKIVSQISQLTAGWWWRSIPITP
jgi:hypothetical protein